MKINVVGMGVMGYQIASLLYLLGYDVAVTSRGGVNEKKMQGTTQQQAHHTFQRAREAYIHAIQKRQNFRE